MSVRAVVRTFSELCVTVGTLIVLFVVYVMFWTGIKAADASDGQIHSLQGTWARGSLPTTAPGTAAPEAAAPPAPEAYEPGRPFAVMYVPRLGKDWDWPVLEGTRTRTLQKGLGHYEGTARLGETGNFSVAGHRRTYGDPFKDFPRLRPGDAVVLTDGATWFTYRVANTPYRTVPSDIGVIDDVPRKAGLDGPGRYLTLTTCEPEWGSSHRLVVWAHLDATQPVEEGKPRALSG
ncbi:class E sortase [Streptomyces sp. ISL-99]|uniref:class E sortase n=1 Tax=Streptomyces sp. ISL-99 TaxID=2819193 RepID=UPI001BE84B75|nr:class E sortase [Streptomyces sp. ISL-99]MBT2524354.1 class E sortase [Streptomyces sp. ISL-99]